MLQTLSHAVVRIDKAVVDRMVGLHGRNRFADNFATLLASSAPHVYALGFIGAWYALGRNDFEQRIHILSSVAAGATGVLLARTTSSFVPRTRPFASHDSAITGLIEHRPSPSFPSTHAAGAVGFLVGLGSRPVSLVAVFAPLTVGVVGARIYSGVHWPSDVLAGSVVGVASGLLVGQADEILRPLTRWITRLTPLL